MNTGLKVLISLAIAGLATAAAAAAELGPPGPLGLLFVVATCATALLTGMKGASSQATSTKSTSTQGATGTSASSSATKESTDAAPARIHSGANREEGTVKWFNVSKGFGFIVRDNEEEIFVHFRSILGENRGKRSLRDGQRVAYTVVNSDKGPQAEDVEPL
jgi:CspA family cold shock protein